MTQSRNKRWKQAHGIDKSWNTERAFGKSESKQGRENLAAETVQQCEVPVVGCYISDLGRGRCDLRGEDVVDADLGGRLVERRFVGRKIVWATLPGDLYEAICMSDCGERSVWSKLVCVP